MTPETVTATGRERHTGGACRLMPFFSPVPQNGRGERTRQPLHPTKPLDLTAGVCSKSAARLHHHSTGITLAPDGAKTAA